MNRKFGGGKAPTGTPSLPLSSVVVICSLLAGASLVHNIYKPNLITAENDSNSQREKVVIDLDEESGGREVSDDSDVMEVIQVDGLEANAKVVEIGVQRRSTSSPDSALTNAIVNLEQHDLSSVRVYNKLLEGVQRRTDTIQSLDFQIELNEKRRDTFQLLRPKKEELVEVIVAFEIQDM